MRAATTFRHSPTRPLQWRVERGLDQLDNAVDVLGRFLSEPGAPDHKDFPAWREHLVGAFETLRHVTASLPGNATGGDVTSAGNAIRNGSCGECNATMTVQRTTRRYCSVRCRVAAHRRGNGNA